MSTSNNRGNCRNMDMLTSQQTKILNYNIIHHKMLWCADSQMTNLKVKQTQCSYWTQATQTESANLSTVKKTFRRWSTCWTKVKNSVRAASFKVTTSEHQPITSQRKTTDSPSQSCTNPQSIRNHLGKYWPLQAWCHTKIKCLLLRQQQARLGSRIRWKVKEVWANQIQTLWH